VTFFTASAGATVPYLLLAFLGAAALSFVLTPLVRRIAIHVDAIDHPEHRRVNDVPVPRGGGVAVAVAFVVVAILVMSSDGLGSRWSADTYPGLLSRHPTHIAAILYRDHARGTDDATIVAIRLGTAR
jgi:UDP-N-acetylmuramyl pentapeptide phosphotransferase/UDP-N-acetylglucosamine-1-phosphate transferase